MSHYKKPKRIRIILWLMLIGIILAAFAGVIVPYLPTAGDDIVEMTADLATGDNTTAEVVVDTGTQIAPDSILNQFQSGDTILSGDATTGSN